MKYRVTPDEKGLDVVISELDGQDEALLGAFKACSEGRCSCPTEEYRKLESLTVERSGADIRLRLGAREGTVLDPREIERCLAHTGRAVDAVDDDPDAPR